MDSRFEPYKQPEITAEELQQYLKGPKVEGKFLVQMDEKGIYRLLYRSDSGHQILVKYNNGTCKLSRDDKGHVVNLNIEPKTIEDLDNWIEKICESYPGEKNLRASQQSQSVNITEKKPDKVEKRYKVLFPLHGIRTHGKWIDQLNTVAQSEQNLNRWHCRFDRWRFGKYYLFQFVLPWSRDKKVRWFRDTYTDEMGDKSLKVSEGEYPSVVAHSFGTYILGYALQKYENIKFEKVILCGSILPIDFPWDVIINRGQVQEIRNEYGVKDFWCKNVGHFINGTGPSGVYGFNFEHENLEQKEFLFDHSEYFNKSHIRDYWMPFLDAKSQHNYLESTYLDEPQKITKNRDNVELSSKKLIEEVFNTDPLVSNPAAEKLKGRVDLAERLVAEGFSSPVVRKSIQKVLESFPEYSAELLVKAIENCDISGDSWGRASIASRLFTPKHQAFAEGKLRDILQYGHIEKKRHALTALGNIARLSGYNTEVLRLVKNNELKLLGFAVEGSFQNFRLAEDYYSFHRYTIRSASELVQTLYIRGSNPFKFVGFKALSNLHVDEILEYWINSDEKRLVILGIKLLGYLKVERTAKKILKIFKITRDSSICRAALQSLWRIGEPASINELLGLNLSPTGPGLMSIQDEELYYKAAQNYLENDQAWYACRSFGLRNIENKIPLLKGILSHSDSLIRGSAALALSRLGFKDDLEKAYRESSSTPEKILTALALIKSEPSRYSSLESSLRKNLSEGVILDQEEIQEDMLDVLGSCPVKVAQELAAAWEPHFKEALLVV